ncbi:MAG: hypothetical protein SGCHY_004296 [Lobulomycetales sp.]
MNERLQMRMSGPEYSRLIALLRQNMHNPYTQRFRQQVPLQAPSPAPKRQLDEYGRSLTLGSRKSARAQVWMIPGDGHVYVNGTHLSSYFQDDAARHTVVSPLTDYSPVSLLSKYNIWALVQSKSGNSQTSQAQAISCAVARGLAMHDPQGVGRRLNQLGLLTIDRRQQERKKTGQPGSRKKIRFVKR